MKKLIFIILSLTFVNAIGQNQIQVKKATVTDQIIYKGDSLGVWEDSAGTMYNRNTGNVEINSDTVYMPNLKVPGGKFQYIMGIDPEGRLFPQPGAYALDTLLMLAADSGSVFLQWERDTTNGYVYPATLTDKVGIGVNDPAEALEVNGNIEIPITSSTAGAIYQNGVRVFHTYDQFGIQSNVFAGNGAGSITTAAVSSVGIGHEALQSVALNSQWNTAVGSQALKNHYFGHGNTAIGAYVLTSNYFGAFNTAVGRNALVNNYEGNNNCAFGEGSLEANISGGANTAYGVLTLLRSSGDGNGAFGMNTLALLKDGERNLGIGYWAGFNLKHGSGNILIGDSVLTPDTSYSYYLNIGDLITGNMAGTKSATIDGNAFITGITRLGNDDAVSDAVPENVLIVNSHYYPAMKLEDTDDTTTFTQMSWNSSEHEFYTLVTDANDTSIYTQDAHGSFILENKDDEASVSLTFRNEADTGMISLDDIGIRVKLGEAEHYFTDEEVEIDGNLQINKHAFYDAVVSNSITSEAVTINWTNGNIQSLALNDTCTVSFTAPSGPCHLTLIVTHAANTTEYPVTWPAGMKWPSATPPTMTAESEAIDIVSFLYDGTSYYGMYGNDFEAIP